MRIKIWAILVFIYLILLFNCSKKSTHKILYINNQKIIVEVADTESKRSKGLMFRKKLDKDTGMLFVFDKSEIVHFWMKNTFIPLSIAFIDTNYRIVHIDDMEPLTLTLHSSIFPVKYALEVKKGWFDEHNIKIGDRVRGIE